MHDVDKFDFFLYDLSQGLEGYSKMIINLDDILMVDSN